MIVVDSWLVYSAMKNYANPNSAGIQKDLLFYVSWELMTTLMT
jgi:hypothetical protein